MEEESGQSMGRALKIGALLGGLRRWSAFGFGSRCKPFTYGDASPVIGQARFPADISFCELGAHIKGSGFSVTVEFRKDTSQDESGSRCAGNPNGGMVIQVPHPHPHGEPIIISHGPGITVVTGSPCFDGGLNWKSQQASLSEFKSSSVWIRQDVADDGGGFRGKYPDSPVLPVFFIHDGLEWTVNTLVRQDRISAHQFLQGDFAVSQGQPFAVKVRVLIQAMDSQASEAA